MYKEQKLKANHNMKLKFKVTATVVIKCTKNKSWKQITTIHKKSSDSGKLLSNVQRTKVESKSQPETLDLQIESSCYQMYKEQKLKANHNWQ